MGRRERHDADYFPFYVKDGKTLFILESKYGLQGIGFFTNLMRFLTRQTDHHICIKDESDRIYFFAQIHCPEDIGTDMISLMTKTGKIDKDLWEKHRVIVSQDLLDSLKEAYKNRNNPIIEIAQIRLSYPENKITYQENPITSPNNPQRKGKERKGKERQGRGVGEPSEAVDNSDGQKPPFEPKPEDQKPKPEELEEDVPFPGEEPKRGNAHAERWTGKQNEQLNELMEDIVKRYGFKYHGMVLAWARDNLNRKNPDAMLHCLRRLISDRMQGKPVPMPGRWLDAALNGNGKHPGENGRFEAEETVREAQAMNGPVSDTARRLTAGIGR